MVQHAAYDAPEKGSLSKFQKFIMHTAEHTEQEIASRFIHLQYVFEYSYTAFLRLNPLQRKKFFDELVNPVKTYPILMAFYTWMGDLELSFENIDFYHYEEDFVLIAQHANPILLAEALVLLYKYELLTGFGAQQYRQLVANHINPMVVAKAFIRLSQAPFSPVGHVLEDRWCIGRHSEPEEVVSTLLEMSKRNLFNETGNLWRKQILVHQHPLSLLLAIWDCKQLGFLAGDLGQTVLDALCRYEQPQEVSGALGRIAARDSIDHPRFLIMNSLQAYILRIESNKIPGSDDVSFEHGFVFFAQYRAKNRRTNYDLAKQLFHTLLFCPTQSISDIFAQVTASGSELCTDKKNNYAHNRLIASDELNGIFQQVLQLNMQENSPMSDKRRLL